MNFKGRSYGPILRCLVFRKLYGPMALKVLSKVFPDTGIGPCMAHESFQTLIK